MSTSPVFVSRVPSLLLVILIAGLATTGIGCQKISDMKAAAEAASQAFSEAQTATSSAEAGEKMGTAFSKLREAVGGGSAVQAVDFRELTAVLPATVPGMTQEDVLGERGSQMGFSTSKAEGHYRGESEPSKRITMTVTDLGSMSGLGAVTNRLNAWGQSEAESTSGYDRSATIRGYDGREAFRSYDQGRSIGTLSFLVAGRFQVEVEGRNVPMETLMAAVDGLDLSALEALRDTGVGVEDGAGERVAGMYEEYHRAEQQNATAAGESSSTADAPRPTVVSGAALEALLPTQAAGLPRTTMTHESQAMGPAATIVQAEARYEDGARRLDVRVTDYAEAMAHGVLPGASWMLFDVQREHDAGYEKTTTINGDPAREVFQRRGDATECEVEIVVGRRFLVVVNAVNVPMADVKAVIDQVGTDRIEALGKTPA